MRDRLILLLGLIPAVTGCYSYEVTTLADVEPGTPVRVLVSPDEAERLAELRMSEERLVPGTLIRHDNDGILLETPVVGLDPQRAGSALTQRIEIRNDVIREVELRRLDRLRTGALVVGATAAVGYVIAVALDGGRNDNDDDPGPGIPELRRGPRVHFALPVRF